MNIRERIEYNEEITLSKYASLSKNTKGRKKNIDKCDIRTEYQRDRDRIIHCKSFRRLKHKTQVFLSPEGDHYRTRLTHTLEVSQISRTIARSLRLNEDLAEAISLGHDLGHTPYGHIGESTLNSITSNGFKHNEQSLRVVEFLENGEGLNLTEEVRDGILNHSGKNNPHTLEGMCVRIADRIAYLNHDIDDAIRAGIITLNDLPKISLNKLGYTHGERIENMIKDIIKTSYDSNFVKMSDDMYDAMMILRKYMFANVYQADWRKPEENKCDYIIKTLFDHFIANPAKMPVEYVDIVYMDGTEKAVCDYIACMTDRYATSLFCEMFVPKSFVDLKSDNILA